MKKMLAIAVLSCILCGCASTGVDVKPAQLTDFKAGFTTDTEVVRALGAPTSSTTGSDGTRTMIYSFAHAKIRGATFIPVVGLFAGGSDVTANSTIFSFDKAGKMISYRTSQSQYGTATGLAAGGAPIDTAQPR